ncbi:MAG: hypothetical protein WCH59_09250 [Chitinophagia bacterium]
MRTFRLKLIEKLFNWLLKPHEQAIAAQKILYKTNQMPEVKKEFEKAFGLDQVRRTKAQWQNLVRVYGIETVMKIEGMSENAIKLKCMKFSDRIKEEFKKK